MLNPATSTDTPNVTSSPAWEAGQLLLDLQDFPTIERSGPPRARASRTASQAKAPAQLMRGTYGPTSFASFVPDGPLSLWESKLRQRLARIGSSECDLTWKALPMSDGVLLSRLVPSTPRTVEIDSGLLLEAALWVTCTTRDHKDTPGMSMIRPDGRSRCDQLPRQVAATAAMWPTATAVDGQRGLTTRPQDTGVPLPQRVGLVLGIQPAGSSATTAKRGVLNPAFPCWLMGYPLAHLYSGATAMQSFRRLPRK